ncbi:hypothetical protein [Budvicia aquatica]|uniref:hypothetical protein n=1 Tax=Budvicia aquatica TaxID=82979 RepID=UPI002084F599|nr:hypothetical protein [Budvicia aquatica]GKX53569.1 hypothetical protein SOASR029_38780 [Budvicia aquatica]
MQDNKSQEAQALFIQRNFYQHMHSAALNAALKGMDDVVTRKVVSHKDLNARRLIKSA